MLLMWQVRGTIRDNWNEEIISVVEDHDVAVERAKHFAKQPQYVRVYVRPKNMSREELCFIYETWGCKDAYEGEEPLIEVIPPFGRQAYRQGYERAKSEINQQSARTNERL